jgi:hypothetical protein
MGAAALPGQAGPDGAALYPHRQVSPEISVPSILLPDNEARSAVKNSDYFLQRKLSNCYIAALQHCFKRAKKEAHALPSL